LSIGGGVMAKATIGMRLVDGDKFIKALEKLSIEVQSKAVHDAIDAGTKPVLRAMIANTPESTGSRDRQSKLTRNRWSGSKKLKTTIKAVVRKKTKFGIVNGAVGLVGPSYSDGGGHGNLFARDHKRKVAWGRDTGTTRIVNQFVKKTADETQAQANAAVMAALKNGIDAAAKRIMNG
jgi:hypothetical protein